MGPCRWAKALLIAGASHHAVIAGKADLAAFARGGSTERNKSWAFSRAGQRISAARRTAGSGCSPLRHLGSKISNLGGGIARHFHADAHFYNFRCSPGHVPLPLHFDQAAHPALRTD